MSIKFVTFKEIRGVHIDSTVHIGYKYYIKNLMYLELKSLSFTSEEPHVALEPQVADSWYGEMIFILTCTFVA